MHKVQLTFTPEEATILGTKASQLGYSITKYIKLLVGREVLKETENYPTFALSKKAVNDVAMPALSQGLLLIYDRARQDDPVAYKQPLFDAMIEAMLATQ